MQDLQIKLEQLLKILDDMQAIDPVVIDVREQTTITDYMIICSGRAARHVKAIAQELMEKMKAEAALPSLSDSGTEVGDWALVDFGYFVVHIMQPETRAFYNLEELWQKTA